MTKGSWCLLKYLGIEVDSHGWFILFISSVTQDSTAQCVSTCSFIFHLFLAVFASVISVSCVSLPVFSPPVPLTSSHSLSPLLSFSRPSPALAHCSHAVHPCHETSDSTAFLSFQSPCSSLCLPFSVCVSLGLPFSVFFFFISLVYSQCFPSFP